MRHSASMCKGIVYDVIIVLDDDEGIQQYRLYYKVLLMPYHVTNGQLVISGHSVLKIIFAIWFKPIDITIITVI